MRDRGRDSARPDVLEARYLQMSLDCLRRDPHDLDALEAAGALFLAPGEPGKVLDCFHRITRENPAYPGIWRLKAKAFEALGDAHNALVCRARGADAHS